MTDALRPMTARPRLYEQVLDRLRAYVAEGGLRAGDRLPPERDLAARLGVSRASVKQAITVLEVQGLVEARHGGGTYLMRDSLDAEPVERMVERRRRLPDVLEAREALETKLAELAAERRTDEDLAALHAALDRMVADIEEGGHGVEGDRLFHAAVTAPPTARSSPSSCGPSPTRSPNHAPSPCVSRAARPAPSPSTGRSSTRSRRAVRHRPRRRCAATYGRWRR